jgi:hypothetical protein
MLVCRGPDGLPELLASEARYLSADALPALSVLLGVRILAAHTVPEGVDDLPSADTRILRRLAQAYLDGTTLPVAARDASYYVGRTDAEQFLARALLDIVCVGT